MDIFFILILLAMVGFSVILHEVAHGAVADRLGDPTARLAGRLTLNPIPHIDPFATVLLPALLVFLSSPIVFAAAKPVPYNPFNLRNPRKGSLLIGLAGPATNILLAATLGVFYQVAISPLGADIANAGVLLFLRAAILINVVLAVFNLIPIPPLDGSKVLFALFPGIPLGAQRFLEQFGILLVALLILAANSLILIPAQLLFMLLTGMPSTGFVETLVQIINLF